MPSLSSVLLLSLGAVAVSAHSYVTSIDVDRESYAGFQPTVGAKNDASIVGWSTTATDQGWVGLATYEEPDIICHRNGTNAEVHAPVAAGDKVHIQWHGWPQGHKGPVIDYLASCGDEGCQSVDKTTLEFFKINQRGLVNASAMAPYGEWASDQLIANNNSWLVEIPTSIKPGFYVLRTEIIALHNITSGAQHYPQCLNLEITGDGTEVPSGTLGEQLYNETQPGLDKTLNITTGVTSYLIPGPTLISDAVSIALSNPTPTGTGMPVTATGTASDDLTGTMSAIVAPASVATPTATTTTTGRKHSVRRRWYHQGLGF